MAAVMDLPDSGSYTVYQFLANLAKTYAGWISKKSNNTIKYKWKIISLVNTIIMMMINYPGNNNNKIGQQADLIHIYSNKVLLLL